MRNAAAVPPAEIQANLDASGRVTEPLDDVVDADAVTSDDE